MTMFLFGTVMHSLSLPKTVSSVVFPHKVYGVWIEKWMSGCEKNKNRVLPRQVIPVKSGKSVNNQRCCLISDKRLVNAADRCRITPNNPPKTACRPVEKTQAPNSQPRIFRTAGVILAKSMRKKHPNNTMVGRNSSLVNPNNG